MTSESMDKAIAIGKLPFGVTEPAVYVCGQCRSAEIEAGQGICPTCKAMFGRIEPPQKISPIYLVMALTAVVIAFLWLFGSWSSPVKKEGGSSSPKKRTNEVVKDL